ncbi:MAG: PAS domain S-box protein [Myxococcota bacterium]
MLDRILELTPDLVYVYDLDERRNVFSNRLLADFLGYAQEDLGTDFLIRIIHPDDLDDVVAHHEALRGVADGAFRDLAYRARHQDGSYRSLLSRDSPFERRPDGQVRRILGVCRDVSDERETQAELSRLVSRLQRSNEELKATELRVRQEQTLRERIFESAHDAIVIADASRHIAALNRAALELFGHRMEDVKGQPTAVLYANPQAFLEAGKKHYNVDAHDRSPASFRVRYRRADGTEFLGETAAGVLRRPDGTPDGFLGIIRDVTREAEAHEALARANRRLSASLDTLDQFAYVASHDMRTPLRGIQHIVSFLEEDLPPDVVALLAPRMAQLRERAQRMDMLLQSLLQFVRSTDDAERQLEVDVESVVRSIETTLCYGEAGGRELRLTLDASGLPEATLRSYPVVVQHGLSNLIGNAVVHHDGDVANVHVGARLVEDADGTLLELRVSDDGPGVKPEHRDRIFEVFRTLGNQNTTGMGLALTRRLVQRVGGRVWVEGRGDGARGACFGLLIPSEVT